MKVSVGGDNTFTRRHPISFPPLSEVCSHSLLLSHRRSQVWWTLVFKTLFPDLGCEVLVKHLLQVHKRLAYFHPFIHFAFFSFVSITSITSTRHLVKKMNQWVSFDFFFNLLVLQKKIQKRLISRGYTRPSVPKLSLHYWLYFQEAHQCINDELTRT